jgi:3-oxoacyl-[acyl-carrier-protein] synthase III
MPITATRAARICGVTSSVPASRFDNLADTSEFPREEVEKVVRMAGVKTRHLADDTICSSDLCLAAAQDLLDRLGWAPSSIDALIFVTQSPDYFLPSTSCLVHHELGLPATCATFDVGLGCSGYPYGLWLAAMMLEKPGFRRALVLHGETPARFSDRSDRSVALLFGDAGSATALEASDPDRAEQWWFSLATDGSGWKDLIIEGSGFRDRFPTNPRKQFVSMNGANVFNFAIKRVPPLIEETLAGAGLPKSAIDYFIFHQSNRFIMRHVAGKAGIDEAKIPMTIGDYGSTGGPSVPLTITEGRLARPADRSLRLLLLGYGVGYSWASALVDLPADAVLHHVAVHGRTLAKCV